MWIKWWTTCNIFLVFKSALYHLPFVCFCFRGQWYSLNVWVTDVLWRHACALLLLLSEPGVNLNLSRSCNGEHEGEKKHESSKKVHFHNTCVVVRGPSWVWNLRGRAVDLISEVQYAGEVAPTCLTLRLFFCSACSSPISYRGLAITTTSCLFRGSFIPLIEWYTRRCVYFTCREFQIWFRNSQRSFACHILCVVALRICGPKLARSFMHSACQSLAVCSA